LGTKKRKIKTSNKGNIKSLEDLNEEKPNTDEDQNFFVGSGQNVVGPKSKKKMI